MCASVRIDYTYGINRSTASLKTFAIYRTQGASGSGRIGIPPIRYTLRRILHLTKSNNTLKQDPQRPPGLTVTSSTGSLESDMHRRHTVHRSIFQTQTNFRWFALRTRESIEQCDTRDVVTSDRPRASGSRHKWRSIIYTTEILSRRTYFGKP